MQEHLHTPAADADVCRLWNFWGIRISLIYSDDFEERAGDTAFTIKDEMDLNTLYMHFRKTRGTLSYSLDQKTSHTNK